MDAIERTLLEQIAGLHGIPEGAYHIRSNGETEGVFSTADIEIIDKPEGNGIEVHVKPGTRHKSLHIPVVLSQAGYQETVYNDFYIGEGADVVIIAGCGIHNSSCDTSKHDGIHTFYVGKNAKVRYVEKHYGDGDGTGGKVMNPKTVINLGENSHMEMDTTQIRGIDSTMRTTEAALDAGASFVVTERLMTHGEQEARSEFCVELNGAGSSANVISRSVARDDSRQLFISKLHGNNQCSGHSECDSIIMDNAKIGAVPEITANDPDAALIHEAAIGKIAGEQITKLMTLGLTEAEAEEEIVNGFLK